MGPEHESGIVSNASNARDYEKYMYCTIDSVEMGNRFKI